jgi:hypothetical protein
MGAEDYIGRDCDLSEEYIQPELAEPSKNLWVAACNKKDTRTEKEIHEDFLKNGFC